LEVTAEAALDTAVPVAKAPAKVTNLLLATLEGLALQLESAVERLAEACLLAFEVVVVLLVVVCCCVVLSVVQFVVVVTRKLWTGSSCQFCGPQQQ
jgi:type III secretory pathway component EscU